MAHCIPPAILTATMHDSQEIPEVYKAGHTRITKYCDGNLCLDQDAFDTFLKKSNIGDKAFSIISISGPAREGKSFLMNLILRYFDRKEWQTHNRKATDDETYRMNAFIVDNGFASVTTGLRVYNHTFEVKYDDKPMVIILMDTQGIFDQASNRKDEIFLLTLTTLMSSVQIFNAHRMVNMSLFGALHEAVTYGELSAGKSRFVKLQNLVFLLRDQTKSRKECFKYLMESSNCSRDNKVIRDKIRNIFANVDLFCLPPPGDTVSNFDRSHTEIRKQDINNEFLEAVEAFLTSTISPIGALKPNLTNGKDPIKLRDLLKWLILCDDLFKKAILDERIDPIKIMEASERVAYEDKYEHAYRQFSEEIQSISGQSLATIKTSYENLSTKILDIFNEGVSQWQDASEEGKKHEEKYRNKLLQNMQYAISGKVDAWKILEETRQYNLRMKSEELSDPYVKSVKYCLTVDQLETMTKNFTSKIIKKTSETKYDKKHFEQLIDHKYAEMKQRIEEREEEEKKAKALRQEMYEHKVNKLHDEFVMKIRMVKGTTEEIIRESYNKLYVEMLDSFEKAVLKWDEKTGNEQYRFRYYTILEQKMKTTIKEKVAEWIKRKEEDATFRKIFENELNEFEKQIKSINGPSRDELQGSCERLLEKTLEKYDKKARLNGVGSGRLPDLIPYKETLREKMESAISQKISEWSKKEQAKHEQTLIEKTFDKVYEEFVAKLMAVESNTDEALQKLCKNLTVKTLQYVDDNESLHEIKENESFLSLKRELLVMKMDDAIRKKITEWTRIQAEKEMTFIRDKMEHAQDNFITKIEEAYGYSEEMIRKSYSNLSRKTLQNFKDRTESALRLELSRNRLQTCMEELQETLNVFVKNRVNEWIKEQDMRRRMIKENLEKRNNRRLMDKWLELMNEKANTKEQEIKSLSLNDNDMQDIYKEIRRIVLCEYWSTNLQDIEKLSIKYLNTKLLDEWELITKITGLQSYLPLYPFPDINVTADKVKIARYIDLVDEVVEKFHKCLTEAQANGEFQVGEGNEDFCKDYADTYLKMHFDYLNMIFPDLTKEYEHLEDLLQESEKSIVSMRQKIQVDIVEVLSIVMRKIVSTILQELNEKVAVHHYARENLQSEYLKQCDDAFKKMYEIYIGGCEIQEIRTSVYQAAEVQKILDDLLKRNEDNKDNTIFPDEKNISPRRPKNVVQRISEFFKRLFA